MTNRTAGRQRFRPTVHTKSPARDQGALLVAATRRGPASVCTPQDAPHQEAIAMGVPVPHREVASHLTDRDDREIRFDDLQPENPHLLTASPRHAAPGHDRLPKSWLRTVPLVDPVAVDTDPAAAEDVPDPRTAVRDMHVTATGIVLGAVLELATVVDAAAEELTLALVEFACAVSDLAVRPGGAHALRILLAPYEGRPVTAYDHRPIGVAVGRELGEVA